MSYKYKKIKDMGIVVTLSLREVFDAYFTPSPTTEEKTQDSSGLFSNENPKCLKIILSRLGYLFSEEEFHLSLQTIAKDRLIRSKAGNSTTKDQPESMLKSGFKSLIVF